MTFGQVTWYCQGHPEVSGNTVVLSVAISVEMPVRVVQSIAIPLAHSRTVQQRPVSAAGTRLTVLTSTGRRGPRDDEDWVSAEPIHSRERAYLSGWFQSARIGPQHSNNNDLCASTTNPTSVISLVTSHIMYAVVPTCTPITNVVSATASIFFSLLCTQTRVSCIVATTS